MKAYPTLAETITAALWTVIISLRIDADVRRGVMTPAEAEQIKTTFMEM